MLKSRVLLAFFFLGFFFTSPLFAQGTTPVTAVPSGYELKDLERGFVFSTPTSAWSLNAGQYTVSLTHGTYYDAYISLKKSWYTVTSLDEAYAKRKESLKSYLPGAEILKDNEAVTVGAEPAKSMTYKDPAQKKVYREVIFIHRGVPYELSFTVKEENFEKVKVDFGAILRSIQTF